MDRRLEILNIIHPAIEKMKDRKKGQIAIISSLAGFRGLPSSPAYSASKSAVRVYAEALRGNLGKFGIEVNAICPGYVLTPLVERQIPETAKARGISQEAVIRDVLLAAQPTKCFVQPGQIGALAAFLCTPAASQITGAELPVDGGWTAH